MRSFPGDKFATAVSMEKKFEYIKTSFVVRGVAIKKNLPTKIQLTVQMTWHEGKSEGFCEILPYDKRNRNATSTLRTSILGVEKLYISSNINTKKTFQKKSFDINF